MKHFLHALSGGWDLCLVPSGSLVVLVGVTDGTKVPGSFCSPSFLPSILSTFLPLSLPHFVLCSIFPSSPPTLVSILSGAPCGQSKVLLSVSLSSPDLFHMVLRYVNWGASEVVGRVSVLEDHWSLYCGNCEW